MTKEDNSKSLTLAERLLLKTTINPKKNSNLLYAQHIDLFGENNEYIVMEDDSDFEDDFDCGEEQITYLREEQYVSSCKNNVQQGDGVTNKDDLDGVPITGENEVSVKQPSAQNIVERLYKKPLSEGTKRYLSKKLEEMGIHFSWETQGLNSLDQFKSQFVWASNLKREEKKIRSSNTASKADITKKNLFANQIDLMQVRKKSSKVKETGNADEGHKINSKKIFTEQSDYFIKADQVDTSATQPEVMDISSLSPTFDDIGILGGTMKDDVHTPFSDLQACSFESMDSTDN